MALDEVDWCPQIPPSEHSSEPPSPSITSTAALASSSAPVSPGFLHSPSPTAQKRAHPLDIESSDGDSDSDFEPDGFSFPVHRPRRSNAKEASWKRQRTLRDSANEPGFTPDSIRLTKFQEKLRVDDRHVVFDPRNPRRVRCSRCTIWVIMRTLYDVHRWKEHRTTAKCEKASKTKLVTKSLSTFFTPCPILAPTLPLALSIFLPCPGLHRKSHSQIEHYLRRSVADGGGAPCRNAVAKTLFRKNVCWVALSDAQRRMVLRREKTLFQWTNDRSVGSVFSSMCEDEVRVTGADTQPRPCTSCEDLWGLHTFQVVLRRKMPSQKNMKHVNKLYRCPDLGELYLKHKGLYDILEMVGSLVLLF